MIRKIGHQFLFILIVLITFACGGNTAFAYKPINPDDPYEPFNRVMFTFNDYFDKLILKPVAELYNKIVPKPLAKGFSNFYYNIDTVPTVLNDVLQGNFYQATSDGWRLTINTTVGIVGFFDVAKRMGLEPNSEDFGLTLARWGYTNSNYLVIPFLGPSTVRDTLGFPVNYYYLSIYPYIYPINDRYRLYIFGVVVERADLLRYETLLEQASIDKYVFTRDAYFQHRNYLIERNKELGNPYLEKNKLEEENTPSIGITSASAAEATKAPANTAAATQNEGKETQAAEETKPFVGS